MEKPMKYKFLLLLTFFSSLNFQIIKSNGFSEKFKSKKVWLGIGIAALFGGFLYYWKYIKPENSKNKQSVEKSDAEKLKTETQKEKAEIQNYNSKQDDEGIISIFQDNPSALTDFESLTREEATQQWHIERTGGRTIKVIRKDSKTVGFISYIINALGKGYIFHLGIEQEYKGQGYGKKLLDYAIKNLVSRSKTEKGMFGKDIKNDFYIETYINPSNSSAIKFFTNNNFIQKTYTEDDTVYKVENSYIYMPLE